MKEGMKQKILIFVAGVLVGAVLTTGVFCIFRKDKHPDMPRQMYQEQRENFRENRHMGGDSQGRLDRRKNENGNNNQEQGQKPELPNSDIQNQNAKS